MYKSSERTMNLIMESYGYKGLYIVSSLRNWQKSSAFGNIGSAQSTVYRGFAHISHSMWKLRKDLNDKKPSLNDGKRLDSSYGV